MITEAEKRAKRKYRAKGARFTLEFYPTDIELYEHISRQPKKQTYIKELIRRDIERELKK